MKYKEVIEFITNVAYETQRLKQSIMYFVYEMQRRTQPFICMLHIKRNDRPRLLAAASAMPCKLLKLM